MTNGGENSVTRPSGSGSQMVLFTLFFLLGLLPAIYLHWPLLTEYARFNESPLQNAIYFVGTWFVNVIPLSKVLAILSYGLATAFFPHHFVYSAGFFSKFWAMPILLACVWILHSERWRWLLALKYVSPPAFIGPMTSQGELLSLLEQRNRTFLPLTEELLRQVAHPFVVLGRRRITWERAWSGLLLAAFAYRDSFVPADNAAPGELFLPVSAFVRGLPDDTLISGPPRDLDHIMLLSGKPGLHSFMLDHQWYSGQHAQMRERSHATYSALFASDRESVDALHRDYGVTHLVVPRQLYGSQLRLRHFGSRYDADVRRIVGSRWRFLLEHPPTDAVLYDDGQYRVIGLPLPPQKEYPRLEANLVPPSDAVDPLPLLSGR